MEYSFAGKHGYWKAAHFNELLPHLPEKQVKDDRHASVTLNASHFAYLPCGTVSVSATANIAAREQHLPAPACRVLARIM
jgi:hypothetical protein